MPTTLYFPPEKNIIRYLTHHPLTKDSYVSDLLQTISTVFANQEKYRMGVQLTVIQVLSERKMLPEIGPEILVLNLTQALVDCAQGQLLSIQKKEDQFPSYEKLLEYFRNNSVTNNSFFVEHGILEVMAQEFACSDRSSESIKDKLASVFQRLEKDEIRSLGANLTVVSMCFTKALQDYADQRGEV